MKHFATTSFWTAYNALPEQIRRLADNQYELMKADPRHPSLHLKRVGAYWSVRITLRYRALAIEVDEGLLWFWIGSHADYDQMVR
jgi:hypothetical protein